LNDLLTTETNITSSSVQR